MFSLDRLSAISPPPFPVSNKQSTSLPLPRWSASAPTPSSPPPWSSHSHIPALHTHIAYNPHPPYLQSLYTSQSTPQLSLTAPPKRSTPRNRVFSASHRELTRFPAESFDPPSQSRSALERERGKGTGAVTSEYFASVSLAKRIRS